MARIEWTAPATVPADHPCLSGHFPDRPLVPAVMLLDLASNAISARFPALRLASIGNAKFLRPVLPEVPMTLHLSIDADSSQDISHARFRCALVDGDAATGDFTFIARVIGA